MLARRAHVDESAHHVVQVRSGVTLSVFRYSEGNEPHQFSIPIRPPHSSNRCKDSGAQYLQVAVRDRVRHTRAAAKPLAGTLYHLPGVVDLQSGLTCRIALPPNRGRLLLVHQFHEKRALAGP